MVLACVCSGSSADESEWQLRKEEWFHPSFAAASELWLKLASPALVLVAKHSERETEDKFLAKVLYKREVVELIRNHGIPCNVVLIDEPLDEEDDWIPQLKSLKALKSPTLLIYAPGAAKPAILTSDTTSKDVLAALQAAAAKKPK